MKDYAHLDPTVVDVLNWSTEERIEFSNRDRWIGYTRAQQILDYLEDLLSYPRTLRMPNALLVGESGNGKSTLIDQFTARHPVLMHENGDPVAPVIVMEMPSVPDESRFWTELLLALRIAHRFSDRATEKENQAISILTYANVRVLIIDEIHNILNGTARQQRQFLVVLKRLSNKLKLPIIGVGTRDAILALHTDRQMSSRFEPIGLAKWKLDSEFLRLLVSFERLLPLAMPSNLATRELAVKLHSLSEQTIGGLAQILKRATVMAIRQKQERITPELLDDIKWVKLADYDKHAQVL